MGDTHKVHINKLLKISDDLADFFFFHHNIYALLVLSLVSVTTYSQKHHYLNLKNRVDLSIEVLTALIDNLLKRKRITQKTADELKHDCKMHEDHLAIIVWAYLHAEYGLSKKRS